MNTKSAAFEAGVLDEFEKIAFKIKLPSLDGAIARHQARKALKAMGVTSAASLASKTEEFRRAAARFARTKPYNEIRRLAMAAGPLG